MKIKKPNVVRHFSKNDVGFNVIQRALLQKCKQHLDNVGITWSKYKFSGTKPNSTVTSV